MTLRHWALLGKGSSVAAGTRLVTSAVKPRTRNLYTSRWRKGAEKSAAKEEKLVGIPYSKLSIGVPKESWSGERRVACSPAVTAALSKKGFTLKIEEGAGEKASFRNEDFAAAGGVIVPQKEAFQAGNYYLRSLFPMLCKRWI